jgi:hypothetical protein
MEIIFVLTENKPPFCGVVFDMDSEARMQNKSWVEDYKNFEWEAKLEFDNIRVTLTVWALRTKLKHSYEFYKFNTNTLRIFIKECKNANYINYGHLIRNKDGSHQIAKTPAKNMKWAIKLSDLKFYEEQQL